MRKLNILGYSYSLNLDKKLEDMNGNVGLCDFDRKTLDVANDVDSDVMNSTLIHEIIEAINYHLELKLEHAQIMGLEVGLHQAFNDNGCSITPMREERNYCGRSIGKHCGDVLL